MPERTSDLPISYSDKNKLSLPKNVNLSNPEFNISDKIPILLGADALREILEPGHFQLHKWVANSSELIRHIPPEKRYFDDFKFDRNYNDYPKSPCIQCNVQGDCFKMYSPINTIKEITFTKRKVFSFIAKIYDS
ncbi:hypothetical protein ILUMI_18955 [Ignelater luminosus]|uniref:Uncharacterized protein n=1 Tax=Ignelater luminosus TaxID=2038154 RepID=A0A8K0G6C4_IGNLU|nr:hypothetical protein ILUMI_18955 [Ignelater luminosus]